MDKMELEKLVTERLTIRQIAEKVECSQTNIRYWLKKHGLQTFRGEGGRGRGTYTRDPKPYICSCGETDPQMFYPYKKTCCAKCWSDKSARRGVGNQERAIEVLGGRCVECGYNEHKCALQIHHVDPSKKDPNFTNHRTWAWGRLEKELQFCELLCANCHAVKHWSATYDKHGVKDEN